MIYLKIVIIAILAYNIIGTAVFFATKENDDVAARFIFGLLNIIWILLYIFVFLFKRIKERFFIRSIIENKETNVKYHCEHKYYDDFIFYTDKFKGVSRAAYRKVWKPLNPVTKEMIEEATRHCKYCKHNNKDCTDNGTPLCKHNCWGEVEEYDKFERQ